ncbi:MAG: MBOAT family protein [Candidatus Omnitrophica bacterium]|nr:MBOAT family protein [Candidatus Omnitrophota bacterium]
MLFNSSAFLLFFIIVYGLYIFLDHKWQNRMLLVASYVFYGWWDWRFLFLMFFSTVLDYVCGIGIAGTESIRRKKLFLFLSVAGNLSILGFFKYFNFFVASLQAFLGYFGLTLHPAALHIVLPLGISFYTFQTMSYTIDIYRGDIKPAPKFMDFALFVSFFPQLVAGPIERARHLLPQISSSRILSLEKSGQGCYLIFWGLFQKMFIADNLAGIVDPVFAQSAPYHGASVLVAIYAFALQIYCDFAGYSDIARGLGKCMGFDIMVNFDLPYFAVNPRQFWQKWHISLSTWLKDYLYIPLGGNRKGRVRTYCNIGIVMFLGGLWHGASWTFVVWGVYQGAMLIIHRALEPLLRMIPSTRNVWLKRSRDLACAFIVFHLVCIGWLIFRAQSMAQAWNMLHGLIFNLAAAGPDIYSAVSTLLFVTWFFVLTQIIQYIKKDQMFILRSNVVLQAIFFAVCCYLIVKKGIPNGQAFIYYIF